jgi:ABC-type uncharacterized transport system permease subunit
MATLTVYDTPTAVPTTGFWSRPRRIGVVLAALGLLAAVVFTLAAKSGTHARFTFGEKSTDAGVDVPSQGGTIGFGVLCVLCGAALLSGRADRWLRWLLGVGLAAFMVALLCWQIAGKNPMPLGQTGQGTVDAALPLVLGALAGVLCERTGVINVAIEGQLLTGAFAGALVGTMAASVWAGLLAAAVGGLFIGLLLAVLAIRYLVDQVVLGVVLNVFALGLTGFLYTQLMQPYADRYNQPPVFPVWRIPGLVDIPVIGPTLFATNIFGYLAIVLVIVIQVALFRTRWGLRTRAVGEHPTAADTVGIRVNWTRYRNVLLAGLVAGVGGASLTIGDVGTFTQNMTNGKGFIALAALIFGRWSPTGATLAALLFGFFGELGSFLSNNGSPIPSEFLSMLPYVATIIAVAGLVGRVRAPAADGQPYVKG